METGKNRFLFGDLQIIFVAFWLAVLLFYFSGRQCFYTPGDNSQNEADMEENGRWRSEGRRGG